MNRRHFFETMAKRIATIPLVRAVTMSPVALGGLDESARPQMIASTERLQERPPRSLNVINVQSFGALGDGVTDDTAAINTAIEAAEALGGGEVYFPLGNYLVTPTTFSCLTLVSNITYSGDGYFSCIRARENIGNYSSILRPQSIDTRVEHVTIRNLRFDQQVGSQLAAVAPLAAGIDSMQAVIIAWNASNITVQNCWFDECCGVNTVVFNGHGFTDTENFRVERCLIRWKRLPNSANPDVTHRSYDNSALYIVGRSAHVEDNTFIADPTDGARAACEFHGPMMKFVGNFSDGYQTLINMGTMETVPGDDYAEWTVQGNVAHSLNNAVMVASASGNVADRISIVFNVFHHNTAVHALPIGNSIRVSGDTVANGVIGQLDLSHNIIFYEPDSRTLNWDASTLGVAENFAAILIAGPSTLSIAQVVHNLIINAPTHGMQFGSQLSGSLTKNLFAESNIVVNPGWMQTWAKETPAFVNLEGDLTDVTVTRNTFIDEGVGTPIGFHVLRAFRGGGLGTALRVTFDDNEYRTPNGATLNTWAADFTKIHRSFARVKFEAASVDVGGESLNIVTLVGASTIDTVTATPADAIENGLVYFALVSAADTITLYVRNYSNAPVEMAPHDWRFRLHRTQIDV